MHKKHAPIVVQCPKRWHEMTGGDKVRLCESCQNNVYNLSDMTDEEAKSFMSKPPEGACLIYEHDFLGHIKHQSPAPSRHRRGLGKLLGAALAVAAVLPAQVACGPSEDPNDFKDSYYNSRNPWIDCEERSYYRHPSCPPLDMSQKERDMGESMVDMLVRDMEVAKDLEQGQDASDGGVLDQAQADAEVQLDAEVQADAEAQVDAEAQDGGDAGQADASD